ncbi:MAG: hypothetical protein Q8L26_07695 [Candidatus Omnitrophota bacterium]|nr:hypothetical protein [Candidatus Omnitrophota bacterium]
MENPLRKNLIFALITISIGGLLLHLRIHPLIVDGILEFEHLIPAVFGALSVIVVPCLFLKQNTADLAYLLTGLSVIFGAIIMSHLSIATWEGGVSLLKIMLKTTLADSLILLAKFFIGKALFESYFPERLKLNCQFPQSFRFLFDGWWLLHFIGITVVYTLGAVLFK